MLWPVITRWPAVITRWPAAITRWPAASTLWPVITRWPAAITRWPAAVTRWRRRRVRHSASFRPAAELLWWPLSKAHRPRRNSARRSTATLRSWERPIARVARRFSWSVLRSRFTPGGGNSSLHRPLLSRDRHHGGGREVGGHFPPTVRF